LNLLLGQAGGGERPLVDLADDLLLAGVVLVTGNKIVRALIMRGINVRLVNVRRVSVGAWQRGH
jgi:hypothetical protein